MTEFPVAGYTFRAERLPPKKAWHVARRLAPVLGGLRTALPTMMELLKPGALDGDDGKIMENAAAVFEPIATALAKMPEDDSNYVIDACLQGVQVQLPEGRGWAPIQAGGQFMFDWITAPIMIQLVWNVLRQNLTDFFPAGASA